MIKTKLKSIEDSLPVKLLLIQIRRHYLLLLLWYILFDAVDGNLFSKLGMPYLFLDAEYLGKVDFLSFSIVGSFLGIFFVAYMAVLYVSHSTSLPFLVSIKKPFFRFCLNASILPLTFLIFYSIKLYQFQKLHAFENSSPLLNVFSLIVGCLFAITLCFLYFFTTQRDLQYIISKGLDQGLKSRFFLLRFLKRERKIFGENLRKIEYWSVSWLFLSPFKIVNVSELSNADVRATRLMFRQNQISIITFHLIIIAFLFVLSVFSETGFFKIPAAATILVIFTILCLLLSAFNFWFGVWQTSAIVVLLFVVNSVSLWFPFYGSSFVYGLNYEQKMETYSIEKLRELNPPTYVKSSIDSTKVILNNWLAKQPVNDEKPVMNIVCVSGGGLRSSLFTYLCLQELEDSTNGKFFNSVSFISGASGGILGAAYYREQQLRKNLYNIKLDPQKSIRNISADMLNPIGFYLVINDFLPFNTKVQRGGYSYPIDRGLAFENAFSANTEDVLNKKVMIYQEPEKKAIIPMLVISPTITNDGRGMIISPQPMGWIIGNSFNNPDGFEFNRMFKDNNADRLNMITALRMNATFPYISPFVALPTKPLVHVMDAGLRDNFGTLYAVKFLSTFSDWINENTSAVNIVVIRDTYQPLPISTRSSGSISSFFMSPMSSLYSNWQTIHDFRFQREFTMVKTKIDVPCEVVNFQYQGLKQNELVSLSWHLTNHEKELIYKMTKREVNKKSLSKIQKQFLLIDKN